MNLKVSVVIPVYNAAKDIERCSHALFGQTLEELECIFVDDCSTDNSTTLIEQVLKHYPQRKNYVKILNQPHNKGVASARQRGLDAATGEYVIHCDSDDWPDADMYETVYNAAVQEDAEVVCCDYCVEYGDRIEHVVFPSNNLKKPSFSIAPVEGAVWNKLIKRQLIKQIGIRFLENVSLGEDFAFVTPCRVMAKKVAVVHRPLYHYNQQNSASITHNYNKERFMQVVYLAERTEEFLKKNGLSEDYFSELNYLKFQAKAFFLMFPEVRDIKLWIRTFPECNKELWQYACPLYLRISAWLISCGMTWTGTLLLNIRDKISKLKINGIYNSSRRGCMEFRRKRC